MRLAVLAPVPLIAAVALLTACGSQQAADGTAASGTTSSSPASVSASASTSSSPSSAGSASAGSSSAGGSGSGTGCPASAKATVQSGWLSGLEFVSARQGWAVGQDVILETSDGGAHWTPQLSGKLNLVSVDFVNADDGWAVGTSTLLATTDGGAHWSSLTEPCPVIRSVHFTSPADGYAVAGGKDAGDSGANGNVPDTGGVLLATTNGGHSWRKVTAPAGIQSVCFSNGRDGWLGAGGLLYRTADGGGTWTALTAKTWSSGQPPAAMTVECAADGTAWALAVGSDVGMSQEQHIAYRANASGAAAVFAEQYFPHPGAKTSGAAPGPYPGPYSALSPLSAVFVDYCDACGAGTAPWDVATVHGTGIALRKEGNVGQLSEPDAASFLSSRAGWVAGSAVEFKGGKSRQQQRIVGTTDGGHTWTVEYASQWSAWTG